MSKTTITIKEEYIKLDSALKLSGAVSTGGEAKLVVKDGLVSHNGAVCTERGRKCREGDEIAYGGKTYLIKRGTV